MKDLAAETPLVTIIVPTIGRPEYIADTLRSVLAQTYTNLQILVSDNAPTVPTSQLLEAAGIADARIGIAQHRVRLDFSAHMNSCIARARGVYLMILSDDDQITPDYVGDLVALLQANPDIRIGLGRQIRIDENDRGLVSKQLTPQQPYVIDGVEFLRGTLAGTLRTDVMTYISMFVRRDDILRAGGFKDYPDGSHADNFIVLGLAVEGRVALSSGVMYYRVYLASFGLRTPFSALLEATRMYTRDALVILDRAPISVVDRKALRNLIKSSNTRTLLGRIRQVYRHRMSILDLLASVLRVVYFRLRRGAP